MAMRLSDIRLAYKIGSLGAVGVLGLLLVGAIYFVGYATQSRYERISSAAAALEAATKDLEIQLLQARRSEKDFLLRKDDKYVKAHEAASSGATRAFDTMRQSLSTLGEGKLVGELDALRQGYDVYSKNFSAVVDLQHKLGLSQDTGLEGSLRASVHDIEHTLASFKDAHLNELMLTMRRHEKDFMLRNDAQYREKFQDSVAKFDAALGASGLGASQQAALRDKLAAYQADFLAYVNGRQALAAKQGETSAAYAKIEPGIEGLAAQIAKLGAQSALEAENVRRATALEFEAAAAGILLIVFVYAYLVGRSITRPLAILVALLQRLARGDYGATIAGTERKDEIGDVARAAEVFKQNGLAKTRMEREQAEASERAAAEREAAMATMAEEFQGAVGDIVRAAAAGDFSKRVALEGKAGLILSVGSSINALCSNVEKALGDLLQMLAALCDGNLTRRIDGAYEGNFATLMRDANATAERIASTIAEIKRASREVANASNEISGSTTDLSQRTEEQAASLEQTSASMEQLSQTVKRNSENAQNADRCAADARKLADRGREVVAHAVKAVAQIESSAHEIADIIGVVDEIARQTNLLALNAAVEAARAGEVGRGFSAVASEVRSLAQRCSQAAKDIKELILNSSNHVKQGVELVNETDASLAAILNSIKAVAGVVSEISEASVEQAAGIEQINKALAQMDEITQRNSALVEENAAAAKTLENQAEAVDKRIAFFRLNETSPGTAGHPSATGAARFRSGALGPRASAA